MGDQMFSPKQWMALGRPVVGPTPWVAKFCMRVLISASLVTVTIVFHALPQVLRSASSNFLPVDVSGQTAVFHTSLGHTVVADNLQVGDVDLKEFQTNLIATLIQRGQISEADADKLMEKSRPEFRYKSVDNGKTVVVTRFDDARPDKKKLF